MVTAADQSAESSADEDIVEWTCDPVDRSAAAQYTHLIRGSDDPERSPRPKGGYTDRSPHLTLRKTNPSHWRELILEHLRDGVPRTFNRLGVELLDKTADVLFTTPVNDALWSLVVDGMVEHTLVAPILFRLRAATEAR